MEWKVSALKKKVEIACQASKEEKEELDELRRVHDKIEVRYLDLKAQLFRLSKLIGNCPTCLRPVGKEIEGPKAELQSLLFGVARKMTSAVAARGKKSEVFMENLRAFEHMKGRLEKLLDLKDSVEDRFHSYQTELASESASAKVESELKATINKSQSKLKIIVKALQQTEREKIFLEYCISVLSRAGLPAHLAYQLCPMLNAAAQQYSKMLTGGLLSVKFVLDGTDIDVQVTNIQGGAGLLDQSNGETRLLSIITGFALRQVLAPCNVIVLDEPGTGLDAHNARVFARAMKRIPESFGSVLLTTHSPAIISELEDCHHLQVVKENRVSHIEV